MISSELFWYNRSLGHEKSDRKLWRYSFNFLVPCSPWIVLNLPLFIIFSIQKSTSVLRFKMVTKEDPELTPTHRLIKSTATQGTTSSEKKLKTVRVTPTHLVEERSPWKPVEEAGPPSRQTSPTPRQRELKTQSFSLRSKGFELHTRHSQLLRPAPERWTPQPSSFENQQGSRPWDPQGYKRLRNSS